METDQPISSAERQSPALRAWATRRREPSDGIYALNPGTDVERAVIRAAQGALARARRVGLPYDLDLPMAMLDAYRTQEGRCALSGLPLSLEIKGAGAAPRPFAPSIDRIEGAKGYTRENTRLVAWAVNCLCGVWGSETALEIARGIVATASTSR